MKRLKNILIFIISITLFVSCDRSNKKVVQENELKRYEDSTLSFIKWLINNDSSKLFSPIINFNNPGSRSYHKVLSSKFDEYSRPLNILTDYKIIKDSMYFSSIDTNLIKDVLLKIRDLTLLDSNLNKLGLTIIDENNIEKYNLEFKSFSKLSTPIFSADYNMVIFEVNLICYPECGYGTEYIYKRTGNRWELIDQKVTWIN